MQKAFDFFVGLDGVDGCGGSTHKNVWPSSRHSERFGFSLGLSTYGIQCWKFDSVSGMQRCLGCTPLHPGAGKSSELLVLRATSDLESHTIQYILFQFFLPVSCIY